MKTIHNFKEELAPEGDNGLVYFGNTFLPYREKQKVDHILVNLVKSHPWFIVLWEKLTDKVPNPSLASPYCCYSNTVVFYLRPYIVRSNTYVWNDGGNYRPCKPGSRYEEWATHEHKLIFDDIVFWQKAMFRVNGGMVVYYRGSWWFRSMARRIN